MKLFHYALRSLRTVHGHSTRMANSALRLIFHRSSRLIFSAGSTNGLIPSRSQQFNISLKRQLSSFFNSSPVLQTSCHRGTTSLVCRKVIQGDITVRPTLCDKELGFRSYSSFEQSCSQVWDLLNVMNLNFHHYIRGNAKYCQQPEPGLSG